MTLAVETHALTKHFGKFTAVNQIDVQVHAGEIFGFLGANGAGKTTAMRMLCGLLQPSSGQGHVAGFDIIKETAKIRTRIGYMSQKFSLYSDLSVQENLELYGNLYGLQGSKLKSTIQEFGERLGLSELYKRLAGELPWGWQQRLALAAACLHRPRILFLDEPTGSVDPLSRRSFWDLIRDFASEGTTIFVTTHYMDEAEYCHRISLMIDGKVALCDTPATLKKQFHANSLQDVFLQAVEAKR